MVKRRRKAGFTMAELLIVVAIVAVLGSVAFVVLVNQMRAMAKTQRDAYAKEIFIAAQNHLAMAKSQGYLGEGSNCGTSEITKVGSDISYENADGETVTISRDGVFFYEVITGTAKVSDVASTGILNLMLPFGSIDDTLRAGGSYIIRYHKEAGEILDVFYWEESGRYSLKYEDDDYSAFLSHREDVDYMKNYSNTESSGAVVGWYGGEDANKLSFGGTLKKPRVSVRNVEKLYVTVKDTNPGEGALKLLVTGNTSGACKEIMLRKPADDEGLSDGGFTVEMLDGDRYQVALDDITSVGGHFYYQFCREACRGKDLSDTKEHWFVPGEDISIQAVAYNNGALTNVAYGSKWTTNSLFGSIKADTNKKYTASITNIRHLENTDIKVSNLAYQDSQEAVPENMEFKHAKQQADLSWTEFVRKINATKPADARELFIYPYTRNEAESDTSEIALTTVANCYYPVTLDNIADYDGTNHSVFGIRVEHTDVFGAGTAGEEEAIAEGAGLFGTLRGATNSETSKLEKKVISNLRLVDSTIVGNGSAGALAGVIEDAEIENVVAFSTDGEYNLATGYLENVVIGANNAGGLIGTAKNSTVSKSAAAMIVNAGANAGGLIGQTEGNTTVIASYSGGHTQEADYAKVHQRYADGTEITTDEGEPLIQYNVTATNENGTAGGLIGAAGGAEITYCYSTCSAFGRISGGLAGEASGTVSYCYATGLVTDENDLSDPFEGAFIGNFDGADDLSTITNCNYLEIVNGRRDMTGDYKYLSAIGNHNSKADIRNLKENNRVKTIDATVEDYEAFVGGNRTAAYMAEHPNAKNWKPAIAYDRYLVNYYNGLYNLRTVEQLVPADNLTADDDDTTDDTDTEETGKISFDEEDLVKIHFGDWPSPEILVINE